MSNVRFTKNQQDAISVESSNILVSAAAGSGKTAVLTERVIRLLTSENPIDASRLAIVTFTVLAAGEMRARISAKLLELIEKQPENRQLQAQQLALPTAKICTIHSLCSSLIRDNFQKLSISPDFRIADETEIGVIKNDAVEQVFGKLYDEKDDAFLELVEQICTRGDSQLSALVLSVYNFVRSLAFPKKFFDDCLCAYRTDSLQKSIWYQGVREHSLLALQSAQQIIDNALLQIDSVEAVKSCYSSAFNYDRSQIEQIMIHLSNDNWDEAVVLASGYQKLKLNAVRGFEDKDFLDDVKALRKQVHDIVANVSGKYLCSTKVEFLDDMGKLLPILTTLFSVVEQVYDGIEVAKQENTLIDFSDLEHFALKLLLKEGTLNERSEIARELALQYDELLIDECQDINEIQNLIFKLLSNDEQNIFMVGDVKQSIYRFRKAMPALFIQKKKAFMPYDFSTHTKQSQAVITLENNFRSRSEVCDTVNFIFEQIMSEQMGEIEYDDSEKLVASASFLQSDDCASEVHIVDTMDKGEESNTEIEARYVARLIKRQVAKKMLVEDKGCFRPCRYGDFAILLRAKSGKSVVYFNALKEAGIAGFCDATEGYFNEYEIAVTLNLLRVLDNPLQDVCLMSVLMSPMFNFDVDAVAKIRLRNKKTPLYVALVEAANDGDMRAADFVQSIAELRKKSKLCTVDELIQAIYDQTDFISLVYALENGSQRDANLRLLLTYASKYETIGSSGLSGFLRYIDRVIKNKQDFSSANISTHSSNTVKIMSIHSSKGLEFPICIVADCAKGFNLKDLIGNYQFNSKLSFGMKITERKKLKRYGNLPYEAVRLATLKETISEEMRILYVALTRAREKLVMVMTMSEPDKKLLSIAQTLDNHKKISSYQVFSAKSYAEWIMMALVRLPEVSARVGRISAWDGVVPDIKLIIDGDILGEEQLPAQAEMQRTAQVDEVLKKKLRTAMDFVYPSSELTKITAKVTATKLSKKDKQGVVELKVNPMFLQEQGLTPQIRGTILHSFMQYADYDKASVDIASELTRLVQQEFMTKSQIDALDLEAISMFLKSNLFEQMQSADRLLREYKFLHFIKAGDVYEDLSAEFCEQEILLQGIADCVIIKDGRATVVDYKTDITNSESVLVERYRNQLMIYKAAIEQSLEMPVDSMKIYSLYMGREIEVK